MTENKKCIICKRIIASDTIIPICPVCRDRAVDTGSKILAGGVVFFLGKAGMHHNDKKVSNAVGDLPRRGV